MGPLFDSFWRAVGYCLMPRIIALSLLPLILMTLVAWGGAHFYWAGAVAWTQAMLEGANWLQLLWGWLHNFGVDNLPVMLAPLLVLMLAIPVIVIICVLVVALFMAPSIVTLVAARRFDQLERKRGGGFFASLLWSLGATLAALMAMVISMPLWLVPPLVLVLPPLIWGWLTYRVMAFDALAEHASRPERREIFKRHRLSLLAIGVLTGMLGAAPAIVWASGVVFAAAFFVLVPVAIWIYTLVFAFSALWFTHYCLAALQQLREQDGNAIYRPEQNPSAITITAPPALPGPPSSDTSSS
mgnify:CR=1 FL=1